MRLSFCVLLKVPVKVLLMMCLLFVVPNSQALMTEVQELKFGNYAITGNDRGSVLIVPYTGAAPWATNKIYIISAGQAGHYQLSGFPANTPLNITIPDFFLTLPESESFKIGQFTHENLITDSSGNAFLKLGATLYTSGNGNPYDDGSYFGNMVITIDF